MNKRAPTHDISPLGCSVPEAASMLGCGVANAWKLVNDGTLASFRLGRRVIVVRESVEAFVRAAAGLETGAAADEPWLAE